jgi:DNA-binding response OmpR family regulator
MTRRRPIVLVVEDDVEMNDLEREFLAVRGLDSVPAYSGAQALEIYAQCKADAILLDIMLPEMDGFECCRRLRATVDHTVPIIILTALDGEDCRRRGYQAGADAYFAKPFDPDEVADTLCRLIGKSHGEGSPGGRGSSSGSG